MYHYTNSARNTHGEVLTGFFVRAVDATTNTGAPLYADENLTPIVSVSGIADAALVDSDGNIDFYIGSGTYHLDFYAPDGATLVKRVRNVPMTLNIFDTTIVGTRDLTLYTKSSAFTFSNSERGGGIYYNGGSPAVGTINTYATTPINLGAVYTIHNGGATLTITPASGVSLFINGAIVSASATIAAGANATLIQWNVNAWTITGVGVS